MYQFQATLIEIFLVFVLFAILVLMVRKLGAALFTSIRTGLPKDGKLLATANWIGDFWIGHTQFFSGITIAVCAYTYADWFPNILGKESAYLAQINPILFVIGSIATLFYFVSYGCQLSRETRLSEVKRERDDIKSVYESALTDFEYVCNGMILNLAKELDFSPTGVSDRITVYFLDESRLIPFGRYSKNPNHNEKGDSFFTTDFGCLGHAWKNGEYFENQFPDPDTHFAEYETKQKEYGLKSRIIKQMKMRSRLYYGWRVLDTHGNRPIAIILVESTDPYRWKEDDLRAYFRSKAVTLRPPIERISKQVGKPSIALKEDF